jgi:alpha-tubulin suppressor-like RCC1 family protein
MKNIVRTSLIGIVVLGCLCLLGWEITHAQEWAGPSQSSQASSLSDWEVMLQAIEQTTIIPPSSLPQGGTVGTFWSAQNPIWPPLPSDVLGLDVWSLGDGSYVLNDTNVDYTAFASGESTAFSPGMAMSMMASSLASSYAYANPVYLTNLTVSFGSQPMSASVSVAGGTNNVPYDLLMSTNLFAPISSWVWLDIAYTSNRYSFSGQPADQAFYLLAKPHKTMTLAWGTNFTGQCDVPPGLTNALMVAGGMYHGLALKADGTLAAWGDNSFNQGSVPTNVTRATMISAGWYHNLAILTNNTVAAWGLHIPLLGYTMTEVPTNLTNVTVISAGALHSLALRGDGTVAAWGSGSDGETNVPPGLSNVVAISAGFMHSLAAKADGTVVAWGGNGFGQCNVPLGLSNVVDVEAGLYHSLALLNNGTVVAWGDGSGGETNVPAGLTNVVAIAANGDPDTDSAYSLALKSDGTILLWGEGAPVSALGGLSNVIAIAAGPDHALAIRTGPATPVITLEPTDQYQVAGSNATFTARGAGLYGVTYQWQTNGVNIAGATNANLTLTNVQTAATQPTYDVVVSNEIASIASPNVHLYLVTPPVIVSQTVLSSQFVLYPTALTLAVAATATGQFNGFPLSYQWQLNGTNVAGATSSNYTFTAAASGIYSVIVANVLGSTNVSWQLFVDYPGGIIPWGSNTNGQLNCPGQTTNVISIAAGKAHGIVALESGSVTNWGSYWTGTNYVAVTSPPLPTNAIAVAAGFRHDLVLRADGTVVGFGLNDFGQTNAPASATNVVAISAGGAQSLALTKTGTVLQWGQTNAPVPAGLTNVTAIASGTNFHLALLQNSTVVSFGANDYSQTNVPAGLSNVVAIAAGGASALALKADGTVTAWGALTNVPIGLSNVMNVAAGESHGIALKNDGTIFAWGDDSFGQTNVVIGSNKVRLIAAGGDFGLAVQFSPLVQYAVQVTKDLLLIYNTNSVDSTTVLNYYLAHRPMVSGANVLGIGCTTNETFLPDEYTNVFAVQVQAWLTANPTKRPQYAVFFPAVPSRVNTNNIPGQYDDDLTALQPSVQYHLHSAFAAGWSPFVTSLNMNANGGTNDCIAYINKLASFGSNYSPGKLLIGAPAQGYGNTNYYFDDTRLGYNSPQPSRGSLAESGVLSANPTASVTYTNAIDTGLGAHITSGVNVAGYLCWGSHSSLGGTYAVNGPVQWQGNSTWWLIRTVESFNGDRITGQGNFLQWFASDAFGGTNYSNTPVGAVSYVDEPTEAGTADATFFGLWETGKNLAICAWQSFTIEPPWPPPFQAVGDPFVTK